MCGCLAVCPGVAGSTALQTAAVHAPAHGVSDAPRDNTHTTGHFAYGVGLGDLHANRLSPAGKDDELMP